MMKVNELMSDHYGRYYGRKNVFDRRCRDICQRKLADKLLSEGGDSLGGTLQEATILF